MLVIGNSLLLRCSSSHTLTIIACEVDPATERIVEYLVADCAAPVNVVFFRYFEDDGRRYWAGTRLIADERIAEPTATASSRAREPWNGGAWYVSLGEFTDGETAMKLGVRFCTFGGADLDLLTGDSADTPR